MANPPERFVTIHRPGSHMAKDGDIVMVHPCPTEIDLVRKLLVLGIKLHHYNYTSDGDMDFCVVQWCYDPTLQELYDGILDH